MLLRLDRAGRRGLTALLPPRSATSRATAALGVVLAVGCGDGRVPEDTARLSWTLSPDPPRIGPAVLELVLADQEARPVVGASWHVEGLMTHPGMAPAIADVTSGPAGRYEARIEFTMAGDWVLLARAEWADGRQLERRIPVRVVP